jgi:hypothetical protein
MANENQNIIGAGQDTARRAPKKKCEQLTLFDMPDIYDSEWQGMPEFDNFEKAVKQIILHFEKWEDVKAFEKLTGQKIMEATKSMWYPEKKVNKVAHLVYKNES